MKKLLLFIALTFAITATSNSIAQNILTVVDSSNPMACDGAAYIDSNSVAANPVWCSGGVVVQTGGLVLDSLCPGTYILTYDDSVGNPMSYTFTITGNVDPCFGLIAVVYQTNATDSSTCDGIAFNDVYGGTAPYSYLWSNGSTTASLSNLCVGTYTCTVTDQNGCTFSSSVNIQDSSALLCSSLNLNISSSNASDNLVCDGLAYAQAFDGTAPYVYSWSNGALNDPQTEFCVGTYVCTVVDANGCTANASVTINAPSLINVTVVDASNPMACDGAAYIDSNSVVNNPVWYFGGNIVQIGGLVLDNLCPGTYILTYTDSFGNPMSYSFVISGNGNPCGGFSSIFNTMNATNSTSCDGSTMCDVWGGVLPYSYVWSNGETTYGINNLCVGTYTVTITDQNGCTITSSVNIMDTSSMLCNNLAVNLSSTDATNAASCDGIAVADVVGGTAPYSYQWNNGSTSVSQTGLCVGSYNCTVTDANGCTTNGTIYIDDASSMVDSILVFNNTSFPGINVIDTLALAYVEDCVLDYGNIGSASISSYNYFSIDSVSVVWTLLDTNGIVVSNYTVSYLVTNPALGVFSATLIVFCPQKASEINTIQITDQILLDPAQMGILENSNIELNVINPFDSELSISFNESMSGTVSLVDINGRILIESSFNNESKIQLNTLNVSSGTYFLTIESNGKIITRKLIK